VYFRLWRVLDLAGLKEDYLVFHLRGGFGFGYDFKSFYAFANC
jgi:hypothetical protein